jgi:cytoplasmic iron level regulating protein YaaA (DUF328/UPF0246 family)
MLAILSPAKTLDLDTPVPAVVATVPRFADDAATLAKAAAKLRPKALQKLMHISPALAELNAARFRDFDPDAAAARPALYTFAGDVYTGLRGPDMDAATRDFAQAHVRILSGLYGLLRPLDLVQPYRLEMGTAFGVGRKKTLYAVWGDRIGAALADDLAGHADQTLVNLASVEYFAAVAVARLPGRVLAIDFRDDHGGELRFNTFVAKKARGSMARFLCDHRLETPAGLKDFTDDGYRFDAARSDDDRWLFVRAAVAAKRRA